MSASADILDKELRILFGTLCDGLRQEVRARQLARQFQGIPPEDYAFSLTRVREEELASSLYFHLRSVGFFVQTESYFATGDERLRPDFRVWSPVREQYLYLELKTYGWGDSYSSYDYTTIEKRIKDDLGKLMSKDLPNGTIVVGFSKTNERKMKMSLLTAYEQLAKEIAGKYSAYQPIECGPRKADLQGLDCMTQYAMVGLWVRKS